MGTEGTVHCGQYTSDYSRSKYLGLCEVQQMVSEGAPIVTVMPSGVFGPGDTKIYGRYVLMYLNGKAPGLIYPESKGAMSYIRDVVEGHVLAARNGRVGEKYIINTANIRSREIYDLVADIAGVPRLKKVISPTMVGLVSSLGEMKAGLTKKPPLLPKGLMNIMKTGGMSVDNSKSIRELGIRYTPMEQAVRETVEWYRANGLAPPAPP